MAETTNTKKTYVITFRLPAVGIEHPYANPDKPVHSIESYINDHRAFVSGTQRPWFTATINRYFEWIAEQNLTPMIDEQIFVSLDNGTLIIKCEPEVVEELKGYPAIDVFKESHFDI